MKKNLIIIAIIIILVIILLSSSLFIVEEGFQAISLRFGKIVNTYTEAGLKFKLPWDVVEIYSKKILSWDGKSDRIPTEQSEAQFIYVDTTARWKIINSTQFYEKLGDRDEALKKLDDIIDSAIRTIISNNLLLEAVRSTRTSLEFKAGDFKSIPDLANILLTGEMVQKKQDSFVTDQTVDSGSSRGSDDQKDSEILSNAVSQYILTSISAEIRQQLEIIKNANTISKSQEKILVDLFNTFLEDPNLYNQQRFADITLIAHARTMIAQKDRTLDELKILNRLLLEAAYIQNISVSPVKKGRVALSREILSQARNSMYEKDIESEEIVYDENGKPVNQFGIELIDIVIRQIKYSDDLKESVYKRMIKERNQIAEKTRSEGIGAKNEILGKLTNEVKQIQSKAIKEAEEIKGKADAEATKIYAEAYEKDVEFFQFWRSLESYKSILPKFSKTLSTDADYFNYLYNQAGR